MFVNEYRFTEAEAAALHPDAAHFLNIGEDGRIGTGRGSPEVQALAKEIAEAAMSGRAEGLSNAQIGNNLARIAGDHGISVPDVYTGLTDAERKKIWGMVYLAGVACLAGAAGTAVFLSLVK